MPAPVILVVVDDAELRGTYLRSISAPVLRGLRGGSRVVGWKGAGPAHAHLPRTDPRCPPWSWSTRSSRRLRNNGRRPAGRVSHNPPQSASFCSCGAWPVAWRPQCKQPWRWVRWTIYVSRAVAPREQWLYLLVDPGVGLAGDAGSAEQVAVTVVGRRRTSDPDLLRDMFSRATSYAFLEPALRRGRLLSGWVWKCLVTAVMAMIRWLGG